MSPPPRPMRGHGHAAGPPRAQGRRPCHPARSALGVQEDPSHPPPPQPRSHLGRKPKGLRGGRRGTRGEGSLGPGAPGSLGAQSLALFQGQRRSGTQPTPLKHPLRGAGQVLALPSRCAHICLPATCHGPTAAVQPLVPRALGRGDDASWTRVCVQSPGPGPSPAGLSAQRSFSGHVPFRASFTNRPRRPGGPALQPDVAQPFDEPLGPRLGCP